MAEIYLWIFIVLLLGGLTHGLAQPARMYQYQYFMAAVFAVFLLPQAISLIRNPGAAVEGVEPVLLMAIACLVMIYLSGSLPTNKSLMKKTALQVDERRLLQAGFVLTVVGTFASIALAKTASEYTGGLWTGTISIYYFFANLELPGAAIALTLGLQRRGAAPWILAAISLIAPIQAVIFAGRRETAAYLLITVGLTIYYRNRWAPPRYAIVLALLFATVIIPAIGQYRSLADKDGWGAIGKIDLLGNLDAFTTQDPAAFAAKEPILELRNAAMLIEGTDASNTYEFGTGYWDEIVWRYVPAQLVGIDFKKAIMFHYNKIDEEDALIKLGYVMPAGSTSTGLGDAYLQFGFAGCIFFCLLGVLMRSLWAASLMKGGLFAQLLYITSVTSAMRAVTNQTSDFLPGLLFNIIFVGVAVRYASVRRRPLTQMYLGRSV